MNCHHGTLLAETALHRLPRPSASQRQKRVLANPTRLCERSEAIHLANRTVPNHGLPRRYAPRRDSNASLRTPLRLCERSEAIHLADRTVPNHGLPRHFAPRRDEYQ